MKNNIKNYAKLLLAMLVLGLFIGTISSCTKMDDYKKYVEGGEISYTGKLDSVKALSGRHRVVVKGLFLSDPKIKKCVIYWKNMTDSVVIPITRTTGVDTLNFSIPNMIEGVHNFVIYTYDGDGNRSIPVYKTGRAYGEVYQATLTNRSLNAAFTNEAGVTTLSWATMDRLSGVFATDVIYLNNNNQEVKVRVPIASNSTTLTNFKEKSTIRFRTLFLPDSLSIDTFMVNYENLYIPKFIKTDVTNSYLKNTGTDIKYSSINSAGRWGILSDWVSNTAVKNASGFGGYERRSNVGYISMEAGWGLSNVTNGLIYQTVTLPAGTYSFELGVLDQNSGGTRYIVVAEGNTLPDVANTTTASLAFATLDKKVLSFTLTEPKTVSIGFSGTLTGTSSTGMYFKIGSVRLYTINYL